jgi:hypothetical protein
VIGFSSVLQEVAQDLLREREVDLAPVRLA